MDADGMDLDTAVGKRLIYTYANGWTHELYVKNATTVDYRIHSGMAGGRWVRDQAANVTALGEGRHAVSWTEPTGTSVSLQLDLGRGRTHGVIFFPRWVADDPQATVCFQNDHLEETARRRDAGPTHPIEVVDEPSEITLLEDPGPDDETVIAQAPGQRTPS